MADAIARREGQAEWRHRPRGNRRHDGRSAARGESTNPHEGAGLTDMFTRKFDRRVHLFLAVGLLSGVVGSSFGAYVLWPSHRERGYTPEQPIPFSHKTHAGTLEMDCLYCHGEAEKGPQATVPPVATCMKCMGTVDPLNAKGEQGLPIRWNKVYDLADFAYFDHSRHLAADVECQECHGKVETMDHLSREYGLKMSWCLDCHQQEPPEGSLAEKRGWPTRAPIHCVTCHR
jgi:hypothetical protein